MRPLRNSGDNYAELKLAYPEVLWSSILQDCTSKPIVFEGAGRTVDLYLIRAHRKKLSSRLSRPLVQKYPPEYSVIITRQDPHASDKSEVMETSLRLKFVSYSYNLQLQVAHVTAPTCRYKSFSRSDINCFVQKRNTTNKPGICDCRMIYVTAIRGRI